MTSALEFTYLYDGFSLRINESTMNRAVRVKTAVKDKIKRIFESKETSVKSDNVVTPVEPVQVPEKESLIDLSQEKKLDLNNILNGLQEQKNVSYTVNRAVLFTQPLVAKINRVSAKWFNGMPRVEKKEENASTDIPSVDMINHLGGEVVPGNWNNVVNEMGENTTLSLEPTLEPVPTMEPVLAPVPEINQTVETTTEPTSQVESNIEPQAEMPKVNIEIPSVSENTDIYRFPSFDFNMDAVAPTITNETINTTFDFVPEPKSINQINNEDYVSESTTIEEKNTVVPTNEFAFEMPNFDSVVPTINNNKELEKETTESVVAPQEEVIKVNNSPMEDKIGELLSKEFTQNPANNFVPEHIDNRPAEDKIDELLGRNQTVEVAKTEPVVTNTVLETKEEKPEFTQGQIIARLRRVNHEMAEKDSMIKNLTSKNETLKEEAAASKDKITDYEIKLSDLSVKNADLMSQNDRLSSRLEEVETSSKTTIAKLEAKVDELTQAKTDEIDSLRRQIEELKTKHTDEISSMREKHSAELKLVTESKDKQIQAIYSTISEALGEPSEDYTRSMAA